MLSMVESIIFILLNHQSNFNEKTLHIEGEWKNRQTRRRMKASHTGTKEGTVSLVTINVVDFLNQCDKSHYLRCH